MQHAGLAVCPCLLLMLAELTVHGTVAAHRETGQTGQTGQTHSVTARAWCSNSVRLDILPTPMPKTAVATVTTRDAMLKKRGLHEMPNALTDVNTSSCTPGPAWNTTAGPLASGNLKVTMAAGAIVFSLVDSGRVLFSAAPQFEEQKRTGTPESGACTVGAVLGMVMTLYRIVSFLPSHMPPPPCVCVWCVCLVRIIRRYPTNAHARAHSYACPRLQVRAVLEGLWC